MILPVEGGGSAQVPLPVVAVGKRWVFDDVAVGSGKRGKRVNVW